MSRIDDLLAELAPEGVPFRPLGELLRYEQPGNYLVSSFNYSDTHPTPVLTAGQTFILGRTDETTGIYPASTEGPVVIFDDFTTAFKWVDFSFKVKSSAMKMLTPRANVDIDLRFAFFAMQMIDYAPRDHARQWISTYSAFSIPFPPIEVQREIVRTLNIFASMVEELDAELQARRTQYAFHRDKVLTFDDQVERRQLGEIGLLFGGLTGKSKADFSDGNALFATYMNVFSNIALRTDIKTRVKIGPLERQRPLRYGDVLFTGSSESADEVGMSSVVTTHLDELIYLNSFTIGWRPHDAELLQPDFAKHVFRSRSLREQIVRTASGVTRINISRSRLAKVEVPVPPRDEQFSIVRVLDGFESFTNDQSIGLPAELAARRKQYEYYRDKLLTFKEAS